MRDSRHNLTHQLLGKRDLKGRLLSDCERIEIRDAKYMSFIADKPDDTTWSYFISKIDDQLVALMGKDAFNAWIDEMAALYPDGSITLRDVYRKTVEKLETERKCHEFPSA